MPSGLTQAEAQLKLKEYGFNEIIEAVKITPFHILLRQVQKNFVVYMLVAASVVSFIVGKSFTAYTILAVIFMVILVGFIQEYKAEQSISNLRKMIMPITIVYRDGKKKEIPSKEIVPGDILILGNGEKIPADCEVIEEHELRLNESALTGESKEIVKKPAIDSNTTDDNHIFMGTYIVNGRCVAKVIHTGMNTKFGKIAHLISTAEKELPLQEKVNNIAKYMVVVALISAAVTGLLVLFRTPELNAAAITDILILVVAMSVSSFPEGFPVVLITTLAAGTKRMSDRNAVVNRVSIIETLGEATVICSDKTGTITRGEMTVKFVFTGDALYEVEGSGYIAHGDITRNGSKVDGAKSQDLKLLTEAGILCNDAYIERTGNDNEFRALGTPTEAALLILGAKSGLFKENYDGERKEEYPFNSARKMMSVLHKEGSNYTVYAKGAPEILLQKCTKYMKDGKETPFSTGERDKVLNMQLEMANNAYRTLVLAYKPLTTFDRSYKEEDFVFLGLIGMEDSPREEVIAAIKTAEGAGIKVVMITGDSKNTAISIAKQVGLGTTVMEGSELDQMSDQEFNLKIREISIFARVRPEHKLRIVRTYKNLGEVVAMTGDGVNDAPALKEAHIGIAMGKNGTDVSRSAADLVLKDDNFATIVIAIAEGRTVFNNLRKFVTYQLSCNLAEITLLFVGVLVAPWLGWSVPLLLSIQILFMNLVTDNLPSITLGLNPTSADIMEEKPRKNEGILNKVLVKLMIQTAFVMAALTMASYFLAFNVFHFSAEVSRTIGLISLIMIEIGTAFSFRSFRKKALNRSPFINRYLLYASLTSFILTLVIVYTPLNKAFETVPLGIMPWLLAFVLMFIGMAIHDVIKDINNKNQEYLDSTT